MKKKRAFLKWAGGKYPLIDKIREYLPEGDCLIEPFVGSGSVFLNTQYDRYILADINDDLINLYNAVKFQTDDFIRDTRDLFSEKNNNPDEYYALRSEFNQSRELYRRALLFLYLNRHCYNGLCRYNSSGDFNVPFGRYKRPYFPENELHWFAEKAQNATFVCEHYSLTLQNAQPGSVIYCDPPYAPLSRTANFTTYHSEGFSEKDQLELVRYAEQLAARRIPVLISNHDTALTKRWYEKATQSEVVQVRRTISRNGTGRSKVEEVLALYSYDASSASDS